MKFQFLPFLATAALLSFTACNTEDKAAMNDKDELHEATADTAVVASTGETVGDMTADGAAGIDNAFDMTNARLNEVTLPEIKNPGITVRGDDNYEVYSVDETVLFDTDKATIKPAAAANLDEIMASINQRFAGKQVRVMGFADARGSASYNMQLGQERANSVKSYLVEKGMPADRVSTESFGERRPEATNATPAGRQENRRVEIAVSVK